MGGKKEKRKWDGSSPVSGRSCSGLKRRFDFCALMSEMVRKESKLKV